jgi:magnesium chelatase family protein
MHVTLTPVLLDMLDANMRAESSAVIRDRVERARCIQRRRYAAMDAVSCNASVSGAWLLRSGQVDADARRVLMDASDSLHLSARAYHRVLRVARTIADLARAEGVTNSHVAEAVRYRPR